MLDFTDVPTLLPLPLLCQYNCLQPLFEYCELMLDPHSCSILALKALNLVREAQKLPCAENLHLGGQWLNVFYYTSEKIP